LYDEFGCAVLVSGCGKSCWFWLASMSNSRCDSVVKFCVCMLYGFGSVRVWVPQVVVAVVVGVFIW